MVHHDPVNVERRDGEVRKARRSFLNGPARESFVLRDESRLVPSLERGPLDGGDEGLFVEAIEVVEVGEVGRGGVKMYGENGRAAKTMEVSDRDAPKGTVCT